VQTWEFKGGYTKRYIDLGIDQAGNLKQAERSEQIPVAPNSADAAITPRVEGWVVPLELRVLAQVTAENAPFVVASVGGLDAVEHNIMIPTIRSIVRNVVGAADRKVLDLMDHRSEVEAAVENAIRPQGLRAGIVIREVRFGDPVLPPELLVSRLRQQLASQLIETYKQEQKAQEQRIQTAQAAASADQQGNLVAAQIDVQRAEQEQKALALRGAGKKQELEQIAEGQKAQALVLGQDRVMILTLSQQILDAISKHPEIVQLMGKIVPNTVVSNGSNGGGITDAATLLGLFLKGSDVQPAPTPAPAGH
jgi:hypothetical protein